MFKRAAWSWYGPASPQAPGPSIDAESGMLDALLHENAVLARELARAQARFSQLLAENGREVERLGGELTLARGALAGRDGRIAQLQVELARARAGLR